MRIKDIDLTGATDYYVRESSYSPGNRFRPTGTQRKPGRYGGNATTLVNGTFVRNEDGGELPSDSYLRRRGDGIRPQAVISTWAAHEQAEAQKREQKREQAVRAAEVHKKRLAAAIQVEELLARCGLEPKAHFLLHATDDVTAHFPRCNANSIPDPDGNYVLARLDVGDALRYGVAKIPLYDLAEAALHDATK